MMLALVCSITSCSSSDDDDSKSVTITDNSHYFKFVLEFDNIADGFGQITGVAGTVKNNMSVQTDIKINGVTNPSYTLYGTEISNSVKIDKNTKTYTVETINKCYALSGGVTLQPDTENGNSEKTTFTITILS